MLVVIGQGVPILNLYLPVMVQMKLLGDGIMSLNTFIELVSFAASVLTIYEFVKARSGSKKFQSFVFGTLSMLLISALIFLLTKIVTFSSSSSCSTSLEILGLKFCLWP